MPGRVKREREREREREKAFFISVRVACRDAEEAWIK